MKPRSLFPSTVVLTFLAGLQGVAGQDTVDVPGDTLEASAITASDPSRGEDDRRLQEELAAAFGRIQGLDSVSVAVEAGVVFLSGSTFSNEDRALADSLARKTPGVLFVDNRITQETSLSGRLRPILSTLEAKGMTALAYIPLLLVAVGILALFLLLARWVYRWDAFFGRVTRNPFLQNLLRQLAGTSIAVLGLLLALELMDATALVGAILGAAGVVGIAVGFAFRNIVENYLAGIILSVRQPFAPDDHILVEGQEGKVIRLASRETVLMTLDGNHVRIPNATIFNSVIQNYTRNPLRRLRFDLSVGQNEDLTRAQEIGRGAIMGIEGILENPPPRTTITEVGDSSVTIRFFGWVDQTQAAFDRTRSEAIRITKEALDAKGVSMPAPEYGVRFLHETQATEMIPAPSGGEAPPGPAPGPVAEAGEGSAEPPAPQDLGPDRSLDVQIARDRAESEERDLLRPSS